MMKVIRFIFLFYPFVISAQISFPIVSTNPVWRVEKGNFFADLYTGDYTLGNEVTLYNKQYREIISNFPPDYIPTVDGYVRNEGKKVYIITFDPWNGGVLSNEKLMYDFSLEINKKVYCAALSLENPTDSTLCWATSTDSIIYRGTKRKIWNVLYAEQSTNPNDTIKFSTIWVEGIGSIKHPFFPLYCISGGCEAISSLVCFEESNTLKYLNPRYSSCNTLITNTKEAITQEEVKLYPRLAAYQITIDNNGLSNLSIRISNSLGQLFMAKQLEKGVNTIDISTLASGIYFATMSDGNKRRTEKFVKK